MVASRSAVAEPVADFRKREIAFVSTPLGELVVEASARGIAHIDLASSNDRAPGSRPAPGGILAEAVRQLEEYFAGSRREFDLPLDLQAGEFERRVLDELARVPYGTTVSYGELAATAGYPGAARAVGNVMRTNQLMIVLPCHRVIGADGSLRGYGGLGCGLDNKRWLLELEGALT
jgi:methylated-DNA-[protein]-cysteine S-methyltransferase